MAPGLDKLQHIVVLMMENRSFDHMLGSLKARDPRIDGLTGNETNPDTTGALAPVLPQAEFQSQLDPDPNHHFPAVDFQIFGGDKSDGRKPTMQGFVRSYFQERRDVKHSRKIMYHFTPEQLPVLSTLATEFAVFNGWFSSIPGPTVCNRAFAHWGTSFGQVGMDIFYVGKQSKSMYERMLDNGHTAKIYYFDQVSSTLQVVNLLQHQPQLFGTFDEFVAACESGNLPEYTFIEPNYTDHGEMLASDQHPDHNVQAGEMFIAEVYNKIRENDALWASTALLIVYDEHGGIYDHVPPPLLPADALDGNTAQPKDTGTDRPFSFDRLGVRVPAVLVSPWIPKGTVVQGRVFEHASIPATATKFFLPNFDAQNPKFRTKREQMADTFLDLLTLDKMRDDCPEFDVEK
jgi:phospholipase C